MAYWLGMQCIAYDYYCLNPIVLINDILCKSYALTFESKLGKDALIERCLFALWYLWLRTMLNFHPSGLVASALVTSNNGTLSKC